MSLIPFLTKIQPYFGKKYFIVCALIIVSPFILAIISSIPKAITGGRMDTGGADPIMFMGKDWSSFFYSMLVLSVGLGAIFLLVGGSMIILGVVVRLIGRFVL
jgi:hypothetical protein